MSITKPTVGQPGWNTAVDALIDLANAAEGGTVAQQPALGKLVAGLTARTSTPCRIAFCGSSTTAGQNATSAANRYVDRLVAAIQAAYPSGLGVETSVIASTSATWGTLSTSAGVHGYNAGEGGTDSSSYLTAGEITNVAGLNPCVIVHMIGANDYYGGVPVATYKANVADAIADLKAAIAGPCVHILVQTYPRSGGSPVAAWEEYGAALAELAAADPDHVLFVDISAPYALLGWPGADPLNLIDTDGVHQTDAGHALMAELLVRALGVPGPRQAAAVTRTAARITSDGPNGSNASDIVGRTSDVLLGGAGRAWTGDATALALTSSAFVRGALNAVWFNGWVEPHADVELSFVLAALPTGASLTVDVHRSAGVGAGTPDAYRIQCNTSGTAQLVKRVSGSTTTLTSTVAVAAGDRLAIRYHRGTLTLRVNGETRASVVDASLPNKGWTGFSGASNVAGFSLTNVTLDVIT